MQSAPQAVLAEVADGQPAHKQGGAVRDAGRQVQQRDGRQVAGQPA
jgi:hypothetical protein